VKGLVGFVCTSRKPITLRDFFEYQVEHNDSELVRSCLTLIDRNLELIERSPTALKGLPLLLSKKEKPSPIPEEHRSLVVPLGEVVKEKEQSLDQGTRSDIGVDLRKRKHRMPEEAQMLPGQVWRSPFAPFVLGKKFPPPLLLFSGPYFVASLLITWLYFHFPSR
jgi:hypothetical protein